MRQWVEALLMVVATLSFVNMLLADETNDILRAGLGALFAVGLVRVMQAEELG